MTTPPTSEATGATLLLRRWRSGDEGALRRLVPLVQDELKRLARHYLRGERRGHTLQTTALVNEAYLRLMGPSAPDCQDRSHFVALAARAMRQVLVDHARARRAAKRGGGDKALPLDECLDSPAPAGVALEQVLSVHDALGRLEELDPRQARVVELRVFGGLTNGEIGEALEVSLATVKREWTAARAWLYGELGRPRGRPSGDGSD